MNLVEKLANQCRKPSGIFGRFMGRVMNIEHKTIREWGLEQISIPPDSAILDIGCGGGKTIFALAEKTPRGKVYGIDYSWDMVLLTRKINKPLIKKGSVALTKGNVSCLPYFDNSFNIITAFETTFFWPNLIENLKEVNRILKSSGTFLIVNEHFKNEKIEPKTLEWSKQAGIYLYSPKEYENILLNAGFADIKINKLSENKWLSVVSSKQ